MDIPTEIKKAKDVLKCWDMEGATVTRINQGLINRTFIVEMADRSKSVLQQLHAAIDPCANENLENITCYIKSQGMSTPELMRTVSGDLFFNHEEAVWRMLTYVEGAAVDSLHTPEMAHSAGALLGTLHRTLATYDGKFRVVSSTKVDFRSRLRILTSSLEKYRSSAYLNEVQELYEIFQQYVTGVADFTTGAIQLVHGDPKISNVLFEKFSSNAVCFVDLDTFAFMPVALEIGDALRSWCNPLPEDNQNSHFDLEFFKSALQGYVADGEHSCEQNIVRQVVSSTIRVYLDLIARFLTDAMEDSYFGWDPTKYASRGQHNLARAKGQLSAVASLCERREEAEQIAIDCLS